ncbi:MAG TPA: leucine--tRNA ligase [Candidatus Saccharimonadales bacterium]|nr:leucine--tRNA ligase [Candidatus Saccharimonadales bacterium]
MKRYNPKEIEPKWQKAWAESGIYKVDTADAQNKFYIIPMFPYPSGDLHVGHWYNFAPTDTIARFRRMKGHRVLHANGFDAFGLPAENAAIKRNIPPAKWTRQNIESMTKQLEAIGASYDWSKRVITCDPEYYKWTQWLFLQLFHKGLAYRKQGLVNWCPKDQTVLANEQVVGEDNHCERCGTPVEQKELEQWYFKITNYADRLLDDLDKVDWPGRVKAMQQNWIGKSSGAKIRFGVEGRSEKLEIFTTRHDTQFGITFIVLAPEHSMVEKVTTEENKAEVTAYVKLASHKTELDRKEGEKDKTGVFTGGYALNPANGEKVPIWVADYVLMNYGTGAVMGVPGHDERDHEFAQKYNLEIRQVLETDTGTEFHSEGLIVNSGKYNGMRSEAMREQILKDFIEQGIAEEQINYRLRDWLISRQRYWGAPIPIIYCDDCGTQAVPEDQLPVLLPEDVEFEPSGQSPLLQIDDFVNTTCPDCGKPAKRETDTMDTFVDSSWYFLRYPNNEYDKGAFDPEILAKWGPVDHYIGGIEHAILHLLYARFVTKFLFDHYELAFDEPFKKLSNQGIILGPDGQKMSKSRGNVVSPDEQVTSYGADSLRLYLMFMGPYDQGGPYSMGGIAGTRRFLERVWTLVQEFTASQKGSEQTDELKRVMHRTIKKVTSDLETMGFNTAIAAMMEAVNELFRIKAGGYKAAEWQWALDNLLKLLAPFAPHITEELWQQLGHESSIHLSEWPKYDEKYLIQDTITVVVQVNGRVRAELQIAADASEADIVSSAKSNEKVGPYLDKEIRKTIYVPDKLVNFVI